MAERRWKKIESGIFASNSPWFLDENDVCYHLMDYLAGRGYSASDANNLINNFKKPVSAKGTNQWKYKERAIVKFAAEIAQALPEGATIIPAPTSKCVTDPEYDDRLIRTANLIARHKPSIRVECPISLRTTGAASHTGGTRRPNDLIQLLQWDGFSGPVPKVVFLIDDVITTGGHFKACKNLILQHHPDIRVVGVFWARTIHQDDLEA